MFAVLSLCASGPRSAAQTFTTLLSFDGANGANSAAGLIQATDGNLYGTTSEGGAHSDGSIFRISPNGALTTLYSFCSQSACSDGANPVGALIQAKDGDLYGTTELGTVFRITLSGTLTTIGGTGGQFPLAALIQGKDGNFYGTTALIQATDGNFYGTTSGVGFNNLGTVFKITPSGTLTVLHSFDGTDGELSSASLVEGANGDLYGTTEFGANSACSEGCGTIFSLSVGLAR